MLIVFLFLILCASTFGLFNLRVVQIGPLTAQDLLWGVMLLLSLPLYFQQRQKSRSSLFHLLEMSWIIFVVILVLGYLNSPAIYRLGRISNLRLMEKFLLFFPSFAIFSSRVKIRQVIVGGIVIALIGTVLTIAQSLHGLENLFNSPLYEIGRWPGNKMMVGSIARVNLPISIWIAVVILALFVWALVQFRAWQLPVMAFLFIAVVLNFARSMWLGIILAILAEFALLIWSRKLSFSKFFYIALLVLFLSASLSAVSLIGIEGLREAVVDRALTGVNDVFTSSGSYGARLEHVIPIGMGLWRSSPLFGKGLTFILTSEMPFLIDIGFVYVLVSLGIVGLAIVLWLFFVCFIVGLKTLYSGACQRNLYTVIVGTSLVGMVVFSLVYQQWLDEFSMGILGFASALAISIPAVFNKDETKVASSPTRDYFINQPVSRR